jgi:uncharacterized protein
MDLHHKFVVPASFDVAWDAFNDLEGLVPCVPGGELTAAEGDTFSGTVKVKLGPISMLYGGTGEFLERDKAAGRMVVKAKGKDKRGNGTAGATVIAQLTPEGTGTAVDVTTELAVTGKPAQFGRGVIQDVSDKLLGQFVECISAKLGSASAAGPDTSQQPAPAEPNPEPSDNSESSDTEEHIAPRPVPPAPPPRAAEVADHPGHVPTPSVAAKPNELNLMSTVMPVLVRRYALPVVIALVVIAGVWIWLAQ